MALRSGAPARKSQACSADPQSGRCVRLRDERGDALVEGLLALGLVVLVVVLAVQLLAYAHAQSVAQGAAQDGVRAAAVSGPGAGAARARVVLAAAGGTGRGLSAAGSEGGGVVTVRVSGSAPRMFGVPLGIPGVTASATLPRERFPLRERAP